MDQRVLELLAQAARAGEAGKSSLSYLGVIASRGKMGRFRKRLDAKGVAADWIEQLRGPIGLDVGAETPAEIAVAVAAELIAVRKARR